MRNTKDGESWDEMGSQVYGVKLLTFRDLVAPKSQPKNRSKKSKHDKKKKTNRNA